MSYIKSIREMVDAVLDNVQSHAEALELQATLGKKELESRFAEQYQALQAAAVQLHEQLLKAGFPEEQVKAKAQRALDELKLQAALGEMESRDGLEAVRQEVTARFAAFNRALEDIDVDKLGSQAKEVEQALKEYVSKIASLTAQLDARSEHLNKRDDER